MYDYFDRNIFSKYKCGFRKGFSTQQTLLVMLEKMKIARDRKGFCAAVLTDLSKAFDCICHDLLIAKLNAYGLERNALKLVYDYLSNRSQKTKVGSSISTYLDIVYGVPQGSILGPRLFNIDLSDLFFENYSSDFAILLMIPLLMNVVIHLMKSLIILKQPQKKFLNGSVLTT